MAFAIIIEDDADLGIIYAEALKLADFDTEVISNGRIAIDRLSESVPDVVLLDLHLPGVSGTEVLRHIRNDSRLDGTRIIIASADAQAVNMLEDEADLALIKPVTVSQLRSFAARFHPDR